MSLSRAGRPAPPIRLVHLGLGHFFRAHQAWYTDRAGDDWGIAAFSGRSAQLAETLTAQDGLYTLITRAGDGDRLDVISSVARAYPAARHDAWLATVASPGATFTDNIAPFEQRKLWLLNGGHSLLAYAGSARGHETVAEAVADDTCRGWLEAWWAEASRHLTLPEDELVALAAGPDGVRRILEALDPALATDDALVASVRDAV